jgi:hypothetical protein
VENIWAKVALYQSEEYLSLRSRPLLLRLWAGGINLKVKEQSQAIRQLTVVASSTRRKRNGPYTCAIPRNLDGNNLAARVYKTTFHTTPILLFYYYLLDSDLIF